ncbi:MAG TPA: 2-oxoacid:acceptor oxidoreductase family protein [Candidatus Omnitrophota bacterium]|nr:2-oxoacid:acceptor oxidoreductase family protein [Candidatus Omnitrophota bacterium]
MTEKIICAGFGGQGIMAMGKVLALSAMREGKYVSWLPAYGAEVRGGTAYCMVVISDEKIASPCIEKADTLIIMNEPSLKRFKNCIQNNGLLVVNSSMADCKATSRRLKVINVPLTEIASKLGFDKVANTVAIGVYLALKKMISLKTMERSIEELLKHREKLIAVNKRALEEGFFWAQKQASSHGPQLLP